MSSNGKDSHAGRRLTLVRHSISRLDFSIPPNQWGLTDEGRTRCRLLAERLAPQQPVVIVTSEEPKARETGEILAQLLGLSCQTAAGLHEHARAGGQPLDTDDFRRRIETLFAQPDQLVFGLETARGALRRFSAAIDSVMATYPERSVAVVTHGTVMSLYYGHITGQDGWQFWRHLGLPAFYTVSWPDCVVLSRVMEL